MLLNFREPNKGGNQKKYICEEETKTFVHFRYFFSSIFLPCAIIPYCAIIRKSRVIMYFLKKMSFSSSTLVTLKNVKTIGLKELNKSCFCFQGIQHRMKSIKLFFAKRKRKLLLIFVTILWKKLMLSHQRWKFCCWKPQKVSWIYVQGVPG